MASRGEGASTGVEDHQRILEATLDAIPDVIGVQDLDHQVVRYNAAGYAFLGLTPEQVRGRRCYELMGWSEPCKRCATTQAIQRREPTLIEKYVEELECWLEVRAYPVLDEAGAVILVIEHLRDITERKLAERALQESEAKYALVADRANDAIVVLQGGEYVFANAAWGRLIGYSLEELRELSLEVTIAPDQRERVLGYYRARAAGEQVPPVYETRLVHRGGDEVEVELSAAVIDYQGRPATLAVIRDISERRAAERERRELESRAQQTQKLESLGVLAGGIAHDFNNLLVGILGNAGLALLDLSAAAPARPSIEDIEVAAIRAAELVQQMLAYAGKGTLSAQPIDLRVAVREMVKLLKASIDKKATLQLELDEELPAVEIDPAQLRQVLMNLITNASDALDGEVGLVTVSTGTLDLEREELQRLAYLPDELPAGRYCYLRVSDTGAGMDAETRGKLFEPFFTTKFTGRGLGLAAVLGIVRRHRGTIHVESAPGRTVFTVLLPALERGAAPAEQAQEQVGWRGEGVVLLVDDEPLVLTTGRRMLERLGFEVQVAADGHEALVVFRAAPERFALVLLDLSMPVMNGTECLAGLRLIRPEVTVLLSSGYSADEADARFGDLGQAGFIQKPYRYSALAARLEALFARRDKPGSGTG